MYTYIVSLYDSPSYKTPWDFPAATTHLLDYARAQKMFKRVNSSCASHIPHMTLQNTIIKARWGSAYISTAVRRNV